MIFQKNLQQRWTKIQTSELNCVPETGWQIRTASVNDAADIAAIYNYYVLNTVVTFEEKAVAEIEMAARIQNVEVIGLPWIVAEQTGRGIALPNEASVALHEKFGMIKVARFREIGYKAEQWLDVGYWEKLF